MISKGNWRSVTGNRPFFVKIPFLCIMENGKTPPDAPSCILIQPTARHEKPSLEEEMAAIKAAAPLNYVMELFPVDDWTVDLMPWPDRKISKDPHAGFRAGETLRRILDEAASKYPGVPIILGGYSLAGLFSLWASTQTARFTAVAAASPSLWIAEWDIFAPQHPVLAKDVYLSLGDREEISRNSAIARVGDRLRAQYVLLSGQLGENHCTLRWEEGSHFTDNAGRLARAFLWCMEKVAASAAVTRQDQNTVIV